MQGIKIKNFTDLESWKKGHSLVLSIYTLTKAFPREELFGLSNQLKRAVVSITSNIAEGFSRSYSKEKLQFYHIALGSLTEVHNQIIIARDVGYIDERQYQILRGQFDKVGKLLRGLIKFIRGN